MSTHLLSTSSLAKCLSVLSHLILIATISCYSSCPSSQLINTLVAATASAANRSELCECTHLQDGGWEITCYAHTISHSAGTLLTDEFNVVPYAFLIRYESDRQLTIGCDNGAPIYRPAMFQGFNIDTIDTFVFTNCPLPNNLALSVVLHRASSTRIMSSLSTNNLPEKPKKSDSDSLSPEISKVRSLAITLKNSVSLEQLSTVFDGLDSLEHLKLSKFAINDIKSIVDFMELTTPSLTTPFNISEELINADNETKTKKSLDSDEKRAKHFYNVFNFGQQFPNLKSLRLQSFLMELVPGLMYEMLNGLTKLEFLELESNNLDALQESMFSYAGNSLKKLYLYKNTLSQLDWNSFANLSRLEILDLSHNLLTELPAAVLSDLRNLNYFSIKNNKLTQLPEQLFRHNPQLSSIDLSFNRYLRDIPVHLLRGLQRLSNFSVAYCQLQRLSESPELLFRNAASIESIEVQGNRLANLTVNGLFNGNPRLSRLDLSFSNISKMSKDIFGSNSSQISDLNLSRNELEEIPDNLFASLRSLKKLNLMNNKLRQTSHNLFLNLQNLEELNLNKNRITTINSKQNQIPFGLGPKLKKVNIAYNNLTDFDSEFNSINWSLYLNIAELDLRFNNFGGKLRVPIFSSSLASIINLDLSSNKFTSVNVQDLINYDHLSLYNNKSASIVGENRRRDIIKANIWETHIRLDANPINCDCFLEPFLSYAKSRISGPVYQSRSSETTYRKTIFLLDSLDSDVKCDKPDKLKDQPLNEIQLSDLVCDIIDKNICPDTCGCIYRAHDRSAVIDCNNRGLSSLPKELNLSLYYNITLSSNSTIETVDGAILKLRHNFIEDINSLSSMFIRGNEFLKKIKKPSFVEVYMDNNSISNIGDDIIPQFYSHNNSSLPLIRILSLTHNQISTIPISVLKNFDSYASHLNEAQMGHNLVEPKLYLGENPYDCRNPKSPPGSECHIRDFKAWLTSHYERVGDINSITCNSVIFNSSAIIVEIPDDVLCPILRTEQTDKILLTLTVMCIILASSLFVVSVLYYRNKQTVLAFIYIHFNPVFICLSFSEDDLDEDKIYDAFVSYSSADRDIVLQLIEKLERPNNEANLILQHTTGASIHEGLTDQIIPENEFKKCQMNLSVRQQSIQQNQYDESHENYFDLCIHERDWLPGNLISWNIVNSVQNSKRTILVLSEDFLKSIWFRVEFHTAYYQMLEDKIDRLIVVVRGELPPKEQLDKDLVFLLTTKTYLVWGEKWFWEKLRYALPHKKSVNRVKSDSNSLSVKSSKNGTNNKSGEVMKDYVDKTIANHFQLNSSANSTKSQPKSLRNSSTESSKVQQSKSMLKNGIENQSFVNETQT